MKYFILIVVVAVLFLMFGWVWIKLVTDTYDKSNEKINVLHEAQNVAMSDHYRIITGYDSVQMIFFKGKWTANFCYPNELPNVTIRLFRWKTDSSIKPVHIK